MGRSNILGDSQAFRLQTPVDVITTANGTSIDLQGTGIEDAVAIMELGVVSGTNPTYDVRIQDSADDSVFADYIQPGESVVVAFPQKTAAGGPFALNLNLRGARRFLRIVSTITGTNTPTFLSSITLHGIPKITPATAQA